MEYLMMLGFVLLMVTPLYAVYRGKAAGRKVKPALVAQIAAFFAVCALICGLSVGSVLAAAEGGAGGASSLDPQAGLGMLSAALSTGLSCIGAGIAVAAAASAAIGAISENEQTFGKALIFVALAEGVALYGFLISFLILGKI